MRKHGMNENLRFDFGNDVLPYPPEKLLPYIKQKENGDWDYCVDEDSIDEFTKYDIESWYRYFVDYADFLTNGYDKEVTDEEIEQITWFNTLSSTQYYPPDYISWYTYKKDNEDFALIEDEKTTDYVRKEFKKWHDYFARCLILGWRGGAEFYLSAKNKEPWDKRLRALWTHKPLKEIKCNCIYHYSIGFIDTEDDFRYFTLPEFEEYVEILNEGRKNWLEEVERQENTPGYLPEDFDQKNLELIRKDFPFDNKLSFHEIIETVDSFVAELNEYLKNRKLEG